MSRKAEKTDKNAAVEKLQLSGKRKFAINGRMPKEQSESDTNIASMMMDARYLRQSASLIQESLQKGFDVLQLANGDIVTTGTKTIVYQYTWDESRGKLMKIKPDASRKAKKMADAVAAIEGGVEEEDSEDA